MCLRGRSRCPWGSNRKEWCRSRSDRCTKQLFEESIDNPSWDSIQNTGWDASQVCVPLVDRSTSVGSMEKVELSAATRSADSAATAMKERIVNCFRCGGWVVMIEFDVGEVGERYP